MNSATLGMLWSLCTNTFIPFFSVFDTTGYSCACAAGITSSNAPAIVLVARLHHLVFIDESLAQPFLYGRIFPSKCLPSFSEWRDTPGRFRTDQFRAAALRESPRFPPSAAIPDIRPRRSRK